MVTIQLLENLLPQTPWMSSTPVIRTSQLNFSFGHGNKTLTDVDLDVPSGSIYGFLGPNGAGKTTTLRLLLGLLRKQQGRIELFGKAFESNRIEILRRLGSLIEQPSLYLHLTARENLEIYRLIYRCDKKRIPEVLETVGLQNTGRKKAKQFSLGMKQRLSIAIALLHKPELLILDEPTNGLDPNGIVEVRELLKKLNREQNTTVIVSSHILNEVERMATHVGIINRGIMVFQGPLHELQNLKTKQSMLEVETSDNTMAVQLLSPSYAAKIAEGKLLLPYENKEQAAVVNKLLVEHGLDVYALHPQQSDLEQLFMEITTN